jgi:regulator of sirC expression with transglutaminase-like and TPR domain
MQAELEASFRALTSGEPGGELEAALLVARWLDADFSSEQVKTQLAELGARCGAQKPWEYLGSLGFAGDMDRYDAPDNSHIARVLERRAGIPISLSIVVIEVARRSGLAAVGINFPGHFLVRVDDRLVDPFAMTLADPTALVAKLPEPQRHRAAGELFAVADAPTIAFRMLSNLKYSFLRRGAWHRAVEALDGQIAILPDYPTMYAERGELWQRLGNQACARSDFEAGLERAEELNAVVLAKDLKQRLSNLTAEPTVVH